MALFQQLRVSPAQVSLAAVLKCGQSFRWSIFPLPTPETKPEAGQGSLDTPLADALKGVPTHEYRLCLKDRVVCLQQSSDTLFYRSAFPDPQPSPAQRAEKEVETLAWIRDYFQMDVDLEDLYAQWALQDKVFAKFQDRFKGIRILRQDPWENLVSFICSSNNNISRITKMVHNLCKQFSPPLLSLPDPSDPSQTNTYHPFPPPSLLATPDVTGTLRTLGFGYRADYIQRTAKMLFDTHTAAPLSSGLREPSEVWLSGLRLQDTSKAREELLKFVGVGRKVADCILLMSLDKKEVVPVDTHVYQIAVKHYGLKGSSGGKVTMTPKLYDEVNARLQSLWGDYAGWAHSVLFTADLKIFSTYGLESSSPVKVQSTSKKAKKAKAITAVMGEPMSPLTPLPSPTQTPVKRKLEVVETVLETTELTTLAERIKRRKRGGKP
ncbi:DNA glycosylase [Coprinopsis marcescibilis]|uniref:DNA-(apurinic or apyrimidinic site) lyase n=1 Tax=Coprinopsis marcescibilis TaxID=230819 RepID=A0A5C3LBI4_COPMA|nr:DNA glycosylase [Coprinopsis marcescibilis]